MKFDIVRLLSDFNVDYDIANEEWVNVQCPFCGDGKKHGGFNLRKGYYNCFKCGYHDATKTLKVILGISDTEFRAIEKEYSNVFFLRGLKSIHSTINKTSITIPGNPLNEREKEYLKSRKFDPDYLMLKYGIKGGGIVGEWKFRIIIPIILNGISVSITSRSILPDQKQRYKTLSNEESVISAKNTLFNIDNCFGEAVIVTEGPFDAMRIGDDCVATLGTGMTSAQRKMLLKFKKVFFLYDPEPNAQVRAQQQAAMLSSLGMKTFVVDLDMNHDPGDMTKEEVADVRRKLLYENG